jgi:hypothetical protein
MAETDVIAYGADELGEQAIFLPKKTAEWIGAVQSALGASTWGELRAAMDKTVPLDPFGGDDRWWTDPDGPEDSDPFDVDSAPGYADGDYPGTPQVWMEGWVPEAVAEKFGEVQNTTLNGDYLYFRAQDVDAVADSLRKLGYTLERNDDLVRSTINY